MDSKISSESTVEHSIVINNINSPIIVLSQMSNLYRTRKILLLLLAFMFTFSLFYLISISFSCVIYTYLWLCDYLNHNYEFAWALISLIYDGIWLFFTYRYCSRGLLFFAWLSTIFLFIFGIFLVMSLLTILRMMMYFHLISNHILITSISSILICILTSILQIIIVLYSFKLSKLISKMNNPTNC